MEKINWINGQAGGTPLSAENLNQMQDNIEGAINEVDDKHTKNVLWENTSQLTEFAGQEIELLSSKYDYLIIYLYRNYTSDEKDMISVIVDKGKRGNIFLCDYYSNTIRIFDRKARDNIGKVLFSDAGINSSTANHVLIPYKIIGCKY